MNKPDLDFGKLYLIDEGGIPHAMGEITEIEEEPVESNEEQIRHLTTEASFTVDAMFINEPFIREIQNQHKKYLRDKAQYKFWKDQEFVGNNRAGRRRK